jgi:hypothetical protein
VKLKSREIVNYTLIGLYVMIYLLLYLHMFLKFEFQNKKKDKKLRNQSIIKKNRIDIKIINLIKFSLTINM